MMSMRMRKKADSNRDNKLATESIMNSTPELEEQVGASGKNKVTKKCLIFEKLIKENISQEPLKRINKATLEVKNATLREQDCQGGPREPQAGDLQPHEQGLGQDPDDQEQLLHEGKGSIQTEVPETQHQRAGHVPEEENRAAPPPPSTATCAWTRPSSRPCPREGTMSSSAKRAS